MMGYALGAGFASVVANVGGLTADITPTLARPIAFWLFAAFLPVALVMLCAAIRLSTSPLSGSERTEG
jgi:hypothetical protein